MILRLILAALLLVSSAAQATITKQQGWTLSSGTATSQSITFASNPTNNQVVAVCVYADDTATTTLNAPTDNFGDAGGSITAWAAMANVPNLASLPGAMHCYWRVVGNGATNKVFTITRGGAGGAIRGAAGAIFSSSLPSPTWTLNVEAAGGNGTGSSPTPGSMVLSGTGDFVAVGAAIFQATTATPATNYTKQIDNTPFNEWAVQDRYLTAGSTETASWSLLASERWVSGSFALRAQGTGPAISGTNPAPSVSDGATGFIINGTNLKAAGNSTVTFGGVSQTVTLQSTTAPQITVDKGTNKYGSCQGSTQTGLPIIVTDSTSAASNTFSTTGIIPPSGNECVDLAGTLVGSGNRITAVSDIASGDQLEYETKGTCGGVKCVIVNADGSFTLDPSVTSFQVKAWTATGGNSWGSFATQTINSASPSYTMFLGHTTP